MEGGCAPLAQLDRASGYEPEGREFESLRARHNFNSVRASETGCPLLIVRELCGLYFLWGGIDVFAPI